MSSHLNKKLSELLEASDILGFKTLVKKILVEDLDDELPAVIDAPALGSIVAVPEDATTISNEADASSNEADAVNRIRKAAVAVGGDEGYYDEGLLDLSVPSLSGAKEFASYLDGDDNVETYEIEGLSFDDMGDITPGDETSLEDIKDGDFAAIEFYVYLNPDLVVEAPVDLDDGDVVDDENGTLQEMKRVVRLSFGSSKRKKMQCQPGYTFHHDEKRCVKRTEGQQVESHKTAKKARVVSKAIAGSSHAQISKKSFKNTAARKKFGSGR